MLVEIEHWRPFSDCLAYFGLIHILIYLDILDILMCVHWWPAVQCIYQGQALFKKICHVEPGHGNQTSWSTFDSHTPTPLPTPPARTSRLYLVWSWECHLVTLCGCQYPDLSGQCLLFPNGRNTHDHKYTWMESVFCCVHVECTGYMYVITLIIDKRQTKSDRWVKDEVICMKFNKVELGLQSCWRPRPSHTTLNQLSRPHTKVCTIPTIPSLGMCYYTVVTVYHI